MPSSLLRTWRGEVSTGRAEHGTPPLDRFDRPKPRRLRPNEISSSAFFVGDRGLGTRSSSARSCLRSLITSRRTLAGRCARGDECDAIRRSLGARGGRRSGGDIIIATSVALLCDSSPSATSGALGCKGRRGDRCQAFVLSAGPLSMARRNSCPCSCARTDTGRKLVVSGAGNSRDFSGGRGVWRGHTEYGAHR